MTVFDQILDINTSIKNTFYHKDKINIKSLKRFKAYKKLSQLKDQVNRYTNLPFYSMDEINSYIKDISINEISYKHCTQIKVIGTDTIAIFEFPIGKGTGIVEINPNSNLVRYTFKNTNGQVSCKSVETKNIYILDPPPNTTPQISQQIMYVATYFGSIYQKDISDYLNKKLNDTEKALND